MICNRGHSKKAPPSTLHARESVTDSSAVHPQKAEYPIRVTDNGMVTDTNDLHSQKE